MYGGKGSAQHFDTADRAKIHRGCLALSVRHGSRDIIDDHPYAADTESGACAKAAYGYLQILCVILTILNDEAWNARQGFGKVDKRTTVPDYP